MIRSRFVGGVLLIVGTSIGGGMLALPVANAAVGFWQSSFFLFLCWIIMTLGALFILEVNLYLPQGKNLPTMAAVTLGKSGIIVTWLTYLVLLYALLAAYISGGADVFGGLLRRSHLPLPDWVMTILFTLLLGSVTFGGIRCVDLCNRWLMFGKLFIYAFLVLLIFPYVQLVNFQGGHAIAITGSIMILITSFGFAIIVPDLRDYFQDDIAQLKKVILVGSLIPLFCYLAWDLVILGCVPTHGAGGLANLVHHPHVTSALANRLADTIKNPFIQALFDGFLAICMLTAFLGVSLCLGSFLADGLKLQRQGRDGWLLFSLTFLLPMMLVIFYPGAYLYALKYAGVCCVILLLLLPALMSICGRSRFAPRYCVLGGRFSQWLVVICALGLLILVGH